VSASLGSLTPGLCDPSHDAQRLFRAVLETFSRPGRIVTLPKAPAAPGGLCPATTAFLLTLADRETPLWLASEFDSPIVRDFLRFHAGTPIVQARGDAVFAVLTARDADPFDGFAIGSDTYPDRSATLLIEVPALGVGTARTWRGPGVDGEVRVPVAGLDDRFWRQWAANHALFPCGLDVVFAAGSQLLALPRSIAVEV
jgi:alpha-D-ribose 1-methylphosphonate 5-triphosphate synthase subunit PhnH